MWGHAPEMYYESGLRPASRWISLPGLMTDGYVTPEHVERVVNELNSLRPAAIIDASSWGGTLVTFPLLQSGSLSRPEGRYVDELDPVRNFVRAHYVFARDVAEWPAYSLDEETTGAEASRTVPHGTPEPFCMR